MTIKQLIKKLSKLNQNAVVYLASDPEGNSYHKLGDKYFYQECFERVGEYDWEDSPFYDDEDEIPEKAKKAIILFP